MVLGTEMGNQSGVYRPPHCSTDDLDSTSHSSHRPSPRDFLGSLSFGIVLLSPGACAALPASSGGADQLEAVVAVAPHPKKVTMEAVALTVAAVALADSRKLDQPTYLGVVAVAAVELADQHSLARPEPASMTDHHEPASKEE